VVTAPRDWMGSGGAVVGRSRPPAQPSAAAALRAAADFIESAGVRSGVDVICGDGEVRISVWEPFADVTARAVIVARLAALIGGTVQQHDNPDYAISDLRADGAIDGMRAAVKTALPVRRTRQLTGAVRPFAESPGGQITAVPGRLPECWRWVTELDANPKRQVPWKLHRTAARATPEGMAGRRTARSCLPLTGAVLQAAARLATAAQAARPVGTAHRAPRQPPR
jgi:hypothetical protein